MLDSAEVISFPCQDTVERASEPVPISAAQLLDEISSAFRRHLSLPNHAPEVIALWVLFAHTFDAWQASPRLLFSSPVPQCGKTKALTMLRNLTPRARHVSNMTAPIVFRLIEQEHPTLLIDEADTFLSGKNDLRGIRTAVTRDPEPTSGAARDRSTNRMPTRPGHPWW